MLIEFNLMKADTRIWDMAATTF